MRARWLKPEFFTDKKVGQMDPVTALVFMALWCWADDGGTAQADPDLIKGQAFARWGAVGVPGITEALRHLSDLKRITLYEVGEEAFAKILNWEKHQSIHKASKFRYPPPPKAVTPKGAAPVPEGSEIPRHSPPPRHLDTKTPRRLDSETPSETPAQSPSLEPPNSNGTEPPHLPAEVDVAPFLEAFYSRGDHRRQVGVVHQLREALSSSGCRIAKGQTLRTTADVMQRGLDQIVRDRARIRVPDRAIVVLLKMLHDGKVNLSLNDKGETPTEAASARDKASAAEDEAVYQARRSRAAAWAKRNPEAMGHIEHRIGLRYGGGKPVDGFKRSVYEQEILAACLKASEVPA